MSSKCQSCGVVGLTVNDVDLAREIVGEGWETMCVECAESLAKHNKSESLKCKLVIRDLWLDANQGVDASEFLEMLPDDLLKIKLT